MALDQYKDEEENVVFMYNTRKLRLIFYKEENLAIESKNGWEKIEIIFTNHYGEKYKESIVL